MKIMIDTNIIISSALFPNGKAAQAFYKSLTPPFEPIVCDYVVDEVHRKFQEKWPDRVVELEEFLDSALTDIQLVPTPEVETAEEAEIRDPKDRPILRAALNEHADMFITGDKDFLESSVTDPRIISSADFLQDNF